MLPRTPQNRTDIEDADVTLHSRPLLDSVFPH
jgi:hypothetical protein